MKMLINGQQVDQIAAQDRGLQYGDGLFETIAVQACWPEYWQQHMQRLSEGCQRLHIPQPDIAILQQEALSLIDDIPQATLKIIITRGSGGRGYQAPDPLRPSRILSLHPWPDYSHINLAEGVTVRSCQTRLSIQPSLAGIKHLNRLEQVLARQELHDPQITEGIMLDTQGQVCEGIMSNLFFVDGDNRLITPALSHCGVKGIMRQQVIQTARDMGQQVVEQDISISQARGYRSMFLTNSLIGVWPVKRWDDTTYRMDNSFVKELLYYFKRTM